MRGDLCAPYIYYLIIGGKSQPQISEHLKHLGYDIPATDIRKLRNKIPATIRSSIKNKKHIAIKELLPFAKSHQFIPLLSLLHYPSTPEQMKTAKLLIFISQNPALSLRLQYMHLRNISEPNIASEIMIINPYITEQIVKEYLHIFFNLTSLDIFVIDELQHKIAGKLGNKNFTAAQIEYKLRLQNNKRNQKIVEGMLTIALKKLKLDSHSQTAEYQKLAQYWMRVIMDLLEKRSDMSDAITDFEFLIDTHTPQFKTIDDLKDEEVL